MEVVNFNESFFFNLGVWMSNLCHKCQWKISCFTLQMVQILSKITTEIIKKLKYELEKNLLQENLTYAYRKFKLKVNKFKE